LAGLIELNVVGVGLVSDICLPPPQSSDDSPMDTAPDGSAEDKRGQQEQVHGD